MLASALAPPVDHREVASLAQDILPIQVRELTLFERDADQVDAIEAHRARLTAGERGRVEPALLDDRVRLEARQRARLELCGQLRGTDGFWGGSAWQIV
jgi:hypothetical protein